MKKCNKTQQNATIKIYIKKVLSRNEDGLKWVIIPRKSDIEIGDYVKIQKLEMENSE